MAEVLQGFEYASKVGRPWKTDFIEGDVKQRLIDLWFEGLTFMQAL